MLVVKMELWPWGQEDKKKLLGQMIIANDGMSSDPKNYGNYYNKIVEDNHVVGLPLKEVEIKCFERLNNSSWQLLQKFLNLMFHNFKEVDNEIHSKS